MLFKLQALPFIGIIICDFLFGKYSRIIFKAGVKSESPVKRKNLSNSLWKASFNKCNAI